MTIFQGRSPFTPASDAAVFVVWVAAPALHEVTEASNRVAYVASASAWRPFAREQELSLADYAAMAAEQLDFAVQVIDIGKTDLHAAGIPVWRDTEHLWPGEDWRVKIRHAITHDALVFLACFSSRSQARDRSYQNEELMLAIEQLRQRFPEDPWLIPIRFDECDIPNRDIGDGRTLQSLHRADLFGDRYNEEAGRLVAAIKRMLSGAKHGHRSGN